MSDVLVRVGIIAGIGVAAVLVGLVSRRLRAPQQPPVDVSWATGDVPVIAFTSTDCSNCAAVLATLTAIDVGVREIAFENEPELFERAGVDGVPLVVVLDAGGRVSWQRSGVLTERAVRRALRRAGR